VENMEIDYPKTTKHIQMKKSQLRKIIKEEISRVLKESEQPDYTEDFYELFQQYDKEHGGGFQDDFKDGDHNARFKNTFSSPDGDYSIFIDDEGIMGLDDKDGDNLSDNVKFEVRGDDIMMSFKYVY